MTFSVSWHTLLEELEDLPENATLVTPLSHKRFHVTDIQEHRVIVEFEESGEKRPLQREQFEIARCTVSKLALIYRSVITTV